MPLIFQFICAVGGGNDAVQCSAACFWVKLFKYKFLWLVIIGSCSGGWLFLPYYFAFVLFDFALNPFSKLTILFVCPNLLIISVSHAVPPPNRPTTPLGTGTIVPPPRPSSRPKLPAGKLTGINEIVRTETLSLDPCFYLALYLN